MGSKSSKPAAPDYTAAAAANRYDQITPFGNQTWSQTGGTPGTEGYWKEMPLNPMRMTGRGGTNTAFSDQSNRVWVPGTPAKGGTWQQTTTLAPKAQEALDSQMNLSAQLGKLSEGQATQVQNQGAFDLSSVPQVADKAYSAFTSRLDPQWQQREEQERTRLANQGIQYGSEAYQNSMRDFNQGRNDAYQQANLGAIQTMPQTYQLAEAAYNQPLNRLNALRTGAQVNSPQFSPQNADFLQAAGMQGQYNQGLYNADQSSNNAMMSGLFGLGAAAIPLMFSDRRLKEDISRVGKTDEGTPIYTYRYKGDPRMQMGVMAQDVEKKTPEAVHEIGGFKAVDYSKVS